MEPHILVIESDETLARRLIAELTSAGYQTGHFRDGLQGFAAARQQCPDLILLNWTLPCLSGLEIVRRLRARGCTAQMMLMNDSPNVQACVMGLDTGANDYVYGSVSIAELLARVRARLRRAKYEENPSILRFGNLSLNQNTRECYRRQRLIQLTVKEFELLKYFMQHPRIVLTRQQIFTSVWGFTFEGESNVIEVLIFALRRKLEAKSRRRLIHNIRGVGYVLREDNMSLVATAA